MATATVHVDDVGGYAGPARCYQLDPPAQIDGETHEYVTAWVQPRYAHQAAEVAVVPATESGASASPSLRRSAGSFVLPVDPDTPERIAGAYWMALLMLGGYEIVPAPVEAATP